MDIHQLASATNVHKIARRDRQKYPHYPTMLFMIQVYDVMVSLNWDPVEMESIEIEKRIFSF